MPRGISHVFDDGASSRRTRRWDIGGDPLPLSSCFETSDRARDMMLAIHSLGSIFTETVMALQGEAAVITYDSTVDVRQPFTRITTSLRTPSPGTIRRFGDAPVRRDGRGRRHAEERAREAAVPMLIVGESLDDGSKANFGAVVRDAEHADITIYAIGPSSMTRDLPRTPRRAGPPQPSSFSSKAATAPET